jgi:tape measure domain-containing protein
VEGGDLRVSAIENRVLSMKFDNAQFERGIRSTLEALGLLNKGLKLDGATKGINNVASAAKNMSLGNIATSVDNLASRFTAMSVVAVTAITNIVNRAVNAGVQLVKSLTVSPISAGLHEYETNLNSIQTILSNTQWQNVGLKQVNAALEELNHYSDQTIYNFAEMARNIGTFTAAGVKLDVSVAAIKGIANLAAVSGSNSLQASTAMYQLSQALAAGKVALIDWNSVVNAGMGGKVFQDALMETARVHGVAIDKMVKDAGGFRNTLEKGWLTSEVLTETLSKFTGDLTAGQLKTMGYNAQQIAGILKMGKTAQDAATKVKTFSQLIGTLQEAAGSGWAQTWQMVFGDFDEAKIMFTNVNNVLGGFISASAEARNKVLGDWKDLGGRTVIIEAISNAFTALVNVIKPIKNAFRQIFPAATGMQLLTLSLAIRDFTAGLIMGAKTADKLRRTFAGVFAVFGIGWEIIKQVVKTFFSLFEGADKGASSFLDITANVGDFLVKLHEAIKDGESLTRFFEKVGSVLKVPIRLLGMFTDLLGQMADGAGNIDTSRFDKFAVRFESFGRLGDIIVNVWARVLGALDAVAKAFAPLAQMMSNFFSDLGTEIQNSMGDLDYSSVLDSLNTGLLAGITALLVKFLSGGGLNLGIGEGFLGSIKESFNELTNTMQAMQTQLKANALLKIAVAIAALTASVVALSMIDSGKLTSALTAMGVMFTELMASMYVFTTFIGTAGFAKMPFVTTSLILLAVAVDLLTIAVGRLAALDWSELAKGLTGVVVLITALAGAAKHSTGSGKGLITAGAGFILLATAVNILVIAVKELSGMDWEEMAKGLTGVATLLGALALFSKFTAAAKGGIAQGAGLILLAVGIKILASAMGDLSALSWGEIAKGLTAMAGSLVLIGAALIAIPPTAPLSAAGVLIVAASLGLIGDAIGKMGAFSWDTIGKGLLTLAGALGLIALALAALPPTALLSAAAIFIVAASLGLIVKALGTMGGMSWGEIAKSLVLLAGALTIIAAAVTAMIIALPGAAALLVVAAALQVLTPVLETLGNMSWGEIAKGLLTLAGVFVILGAAGLLLGPLVPTLIGLGAAILLLGLGVLAAGVGILALSVALTALSVAGAAGTAAIVAMVSAILGLIPMAMTQLGLGIIAFAKVISSGGPAIVSALVTVLMSLLKAIDTVAPKIISTLANLMMKMLTAMVKYVPKMTDAGLKILIAFLQGVANNIGRVVAVATTVMVNFLNGVSKNLPRIIQSGVNLILSFINGLTSAINRNSAAIGQAGARLGMAIITGMVRGIAGGIGEVTAAARRVAAAALDAAKNFLGINSPSKEFYKLGVGSDEGFADGFDAAGNLVTKAATAVGADAILAMRKSISGMADIVGGDIDLQPRITPVLDLSNVKKQSARIGDLLTAQSVSVDMAYTQAKSASVAYQTSQSSKVPAETASQTEMSKNLYFQQTINSPKAVTPAEVYRQTKNQLSAVKKEL